VQVPPLAQGWLAQSSMLVLQVLPL